MRTAYRRARHGAHTRPADRLNRKWPRCHPSYVDPPRSGSSRLRAGSTCARNAPTLPMPMRVLIAEDEKKTRSILVEMVQSLGCEIFEAATGYEAIKQVQENRPDVLLLDGLLPEMH